MRDPSHGREARWSRSGTAQASWASATSPAESRADPHGEAVLRELERWRAPVLTDEEIEIYAKVFLMKRGHELVPFFLWIDDMARISLRGGERVYGDLF
jgi:hypothetical protein